MTEVYDDHRQLRQSFGQFATGVTVVTCSDADGVPWAITVNSFSSVSLDPPLVLWNLGEASRSKAAFLAAGTFAIHVLEAHQQALAEHFARSENARIRGVEFRLSDDRVPVLPGVLARFDCRTASTRRAGDHHIIVGEVVRHVCSPGEPLVFFAGRYHRGLLVAD